MLKGGMLKFKGNKWNLLNFDSFSENNREIAAKVKVQELRKLYGNVKLINL
jgi:hypothetical protein